MKIRPSRFIHNWLDEKCAGVSGTTLDFLKVPLHVFSELDIGPNDNPPAGAKDAFGKYLSQKVAMSKL